MKILAADARIDRRAIYDRRFVAGYPLSVVMGRAPTLAGGMETKFLRLRQPATVGDRIDGWRVCFLGRWDRGRLFYVEMVNRAVRNVTNPSVRISTPICRPGMTSPAPIACHSLAGLLLGCL
jgi:hypothetical protein